MADLVGQDLSNYVPTLYCTLALCTYTLTTYLQTYFSCEGGSPPSGGEDGGRGRGFSHPLPPLILQRPDLAPRLTCHQHIPSSQCPMLDHHCCHGAVCASVCMCACTLCLYTYFIKTHHLPLFSVSRNPATKCSHLSNTDTNSFPKEHHRTCQLQLQLFFNAVTCLIRPCGASPKLLTVYL